MSDGSGDKPGAVSLGAVGDLCRDVDVSSALMANDVFNVTRSIRGLRRSLVGQQDHISDLIIRYDAARQPLDSAGETLRLLQDAAAP